MAATSLMALSMPAVVFAQDGGSSGSSDNSQSKIETVVVTATGTNISGIGPVGSESVSIDRKKALQTGLTNLGDLLITVPQVSLMSSGGGGISTRQGGTSGYGGAGNGGANATQVTAVNLRGVGAQATLTLVDGHRVAPSGATNIYTDINQIPLAAMERIDVVLDGNSAIYGSDAIGGVINIVTRKDFDGIEASARSTFVSGYDEYGASLMGGHSWDNLGPLGAGNFILSADYDYRTPMLNSSRGFLHDDLTRYGGLDNRIPSGAVNHGVGPGQPSNAGLAGPNGDVAYCDVWNAGAQTCGTGAPGSPGFVAPSYVYFGLPAGSNGTGLTTASLTTPTFQDSAPFTDYLGAQLRYQGALFFNQDITNWLNLYVDSFITHRELNSTQSQGGNFGLNITQVCPPGFGVNCAGFGPLPFPYNNPLYIAPPAAPAGSGFTYGGPMNIRYDSTVLGSLVHVRNPDDNYNVIGGVKVKLPFEWNADISATYGRDTTCGECQISTNIDGGAFQYQVNEAALALAGQPIQSSAPINPLSNAPLTPAQIAEVYGTNIQKTHISVNDYLAKFDGPLFDLPGGTVKAAFGGEYYSAGQLVANGANRSFIPGFFAGGGIPPSIDQSVGLIGANGDTSGVGCVQHHFPNCAPRSPNKTLVLNQFGWDNIASKSRHVSSAFVEIFIPVIGDSNALPFVKGFSIDAAERYDSYSDVGSTTNPKVAATWTVTDDFQARGSWGTSFRAPSLADDNPAVFSFKVAIPGNITVNPGAAAASGIPQGPITALILGGNPPILQPEKATTWSVGFDYLPNWLQGFKASLTYYSIAYTNEIAGLNGGLFLSSAQNYALYKKFVTPIHNPATCNPADPTTFDPALLPAFNAFALYGSPYFFGTTPCGVQAVLDQRTTNIAATNQDGIDFNFDYGIDSSVGSWIFGLSGTRMLTDTQSPIQGMPAQSVLGTIYNLQRWKGRGTVTWDEGPWNANLFLNYVGDERNTAPIAGRPQNMIPAWVTLDASVTFDFGQVSDWWGWKGTRLQFSMQNVFDADPPLALTSNASAYDPSQANVYGRIITLNLTKDF
jgi:iron complex outermembrane receptor protein